MFDDRLRTNMPQVYLQQVEAEISIASGADLVDEAANLFKRSPANGAIGCLRVGSLHLERICLVD